ncbi:MAG TPA: hypothetical protein VGP89_18195 [Candidatus Angelobacter sp.]|jgi:hypothetical protein|nr:hypothetical protein [Candidatus Angelobacter sp.]
MNSHNDKPKEDSAMATAPATNRAEAAPTQKTTTALVAAEQPQPQILRPQVPVGFGVILSGFDEAWRMATAIARSDLAPKDYKDKPENCFIAMQMGAEVGLPPMAALQNIAVINGRPSIWGDSALAIVMVHPAFESINEYFEGTGDNKTGVCEIKRRGHALHTVKFSVSDAKTAGLWKKAGPWTNYPDRMLQMRPRGFALRDKFPDALRGLSIAEEAMDIPPDTSRHEAAVATVASELPTDIRRASDTSPEPPRAQYNEAANLEEAREKNSTFSRFKELHEKIYVLDPEVASAYVMGGSPAEVNKMLAEMQSVATNLQAAKDAEKTSAKPEVQGVPLGDLFKK